jgi:hypothetical protein
MNFIFSRLFRNFGLVEIANFELDTRLNCKSVVHFSHIGEPLANVIVLLRIHR